MNFKVRRLAAIGGVMVAGIGCAKAVRDGGSTASAEVTHPAWRSLFNGRDLSGWDTYVGPPINSHADPQKVFSVVTFEGARAVRISGQTFGAITTHEEFENFHIRVEYKWGQLTWPPRKGLPRDSGILYNAIGPDGVGWAKAWMKSIECNIMQKGCGQWWQVDGTEMVDIEAERVTAKNEAAVPYKKESPGELVMVHRKGAPTVNAAGFGVTANVDPEMPHGTWNVVEVISLGTTGLHIVNGQVALVLTNARYTAGGKVLPLHRGKIQIQSEGAEIFYRRIEIRPIREIPREYLAAATFAPVDSEGFTPLLHPDHLPGWAQSGPGRFEVKDGVATGTGGMGLWYFKRKPFGNFVLRGEFAQDDNSDSGIFLRFPDPGDDPWIAVHQGHEIEIGEAQPAKNSTGSIYQFSAPSALPLVPARKWNRYEIICDGAVYTVSLNGQIINRYTDTAGRPRRGFIGLQNYPMAGVVRHRNLRIKELPQDPEPEGLVVPKP